MSVKLSTYNNEALATVCLGYYAQLVESVSYSKAMLLLPLILHEQTSRRLRGTGNKRSLDEFIIGNTDCLINFNKRYIDFLPISINSILMLSEMDIIRVSSKEIFFNFNKTRFNPYSAYNLGTRAKALLKSIDGLVPMLSREDDWAAYLKLKVIL
jgi:hypothetical protein